MTFIEKEDQRSKEFHLQTKQRWARSVDSNPRVNTNIDRGSIYEVYTMQNQRFGSRMCAILKRNVL